MPENRHFLPEGLRPPSTFTLSALKDAQLSGQLLEATVSRCDAAHTLAVPLGTIRGVIPREEAVAPWISGAERDIALLSRVGKRRSFRSNPSLATKRARRWLFCPGRPPRKRPWTTS